ncbi:MAG: efflux transporter periplasmic adaptor subunit [Alphaproteobacteria bacterium]|nr:efflux transporter periplasmic adaptor subunit [Alphaproteobacteria bacterium]
MNDVSHPNPTAAASTETSVGAPPNLDEFLGTPAVSPWRRRAFLIGGGILAVIALLLLSRCFTGSAEGAYATQPVRRGALTVTVSATGNLQPTNQVEVGSEQSGLVTDVYVDNNDRVVKGQPLARLDTARLRDVIIQNQAALASTQAQVAQAQASAVQARANLSRLEEVYRLSGGKVPSRTELDTGRAENQRNAAAVRAAQAQVTQARAALSSAQTNLNKATIYSPVTGVVLSRQIDPGQTVAASFQAPVLFTIAEDLSQMKLEVKVDEADVGQVRAGQRATFTVDAFPGRSFPATITRVDVGANASGTTGSASSSSTAAAGNVVAYTAVLAVQNPELILRPGMTATADIVTTQKQGVLLVPNAALRYSPDREAAAQRGQSGGVTSVLVPRNPRRGGGGGGGAGQQRQVSIGRGSQQTVYVLDDNGGPQPVRITVGESNGSDTEVLSGALRAGMQVITGRLASGQTQQSGSRQGDQGAQPAGGRGSRGRQAAAANGQ